MFRCRARRTVWILDPERTTEYFVSTGRGDLSHRGMFSLGLSLTCLCALR